MASREKRSAGRTVRARRNDQVVLRREPQKYPQFEFRNVAASGHGHIVLRVSPGGDDYRVTIVDDTSESHNVTKVCGPYRSR